MGDQRPPLLDQNPEKLFRAYQEAGVIPPQYNSWQELEADFASRVKDGITEKQARIDMGVDYRNIDGQYLLGKNTASDGSTRYLNKRAIRTDFNPVSERVLREHAGNQNVDNYKLKIRNEWNKHTKGEAQQMGIETGKEFHRGHVQSAMHGGGLTQENMYPEHGMRNVLHGSAPRIPVPIMEDNGIALNDIQAYYNAQLDAEGLGIARPNNALMIAADETMVDPTGRQSYIRNDEAGRAPERMEMTQDRLNQLEAQGISRQATENWSRDQSATLSRGNAVAQSGPVKVVQPPTSRVVNVVPPGKTRATPQRIPVSPKSPAPAQSAKAAASGAPRPVGSQAVLNGNPVVWNGKGWAPVMPNRLTIRSQTKPAAKPTTKPAAKPTTKAASKPTSNKLTIGQSPLSPLNRNSAMYGGTERRTNEAVTEMPGYSPLMLRLAD